MRICLIMVCCIFMCDVSSSEIKQDVVDFGKRLQSDLHSDDLKKVAWAAYYAGKHHSDECVPVLLKYLLAYQYKKEERLEHFASKMVKAALIALRPKLTIEEAIQVLEHGDFDLLAVVAAQDVVFYKDVLFTLHMDERIKHNQGLWQATSNMLAAAQSVAFIKDVLQHTTFELEISVNDPGFRSGGRKRAVGASDGGMRLLDGFPPLVTYQLTTRPRVGDVLLAQGVSDVFLRRIESGGVGLVKTVRNRQQYNWETLHRMASITHEESSLRVHQKEDLDWENLERLTVDTHKIFTKVSNKYEAVVKALSGKKEFADLQNLGLRVDLAPVFNDKREDQSHAALPSAAGLYRQWLAKNYNIQK